MKSITIHGLDGPLWSMLKAKSESESMSLNKTIKMLLEKSLGIRPAKNKERYNEFIEFMGIWTDSDLSEFEKNTKEFSKIDKEDWE
ncbi:MAG: hypothetical protein K8S13_07475 [Desulfobacula sp.]|uniref:hypothetical protein n=1 Tax=Desulfobacula sp. TaxID=2593537 RepID=UPI0025C11EA3|nr:hypothetical protein [Desulfobacula sp.]MCD4719689.1 hypothetical protein [Desulfobacula sp.]